MFCQKCGAEIPDGTAFCPNCGTTQNLASSIQSEPNNKPEKPKKKKKGGWIFLGLAVIIIIIIATTGKKGNSSSTSTSPKSTVPASASTSSASPAKTSTAPAKTSSTPSISWHKSGMYKVGTDIEAGEYFILANGSCYLQVSSDSSGTLDSIVTNANISTFKFVTVQDGQYLTVSDGKFVKSAEAQVPGSKDGKYGEGEYRVGTDIPSGEYKVEALPGDTAYLEVDSNSSGSLENIVSNDNFEGSKYITITDGQYINISDGFIDAK